jgi:hypothetical protein
MKHIIKLIIVLSLSAAACNAQKVKNFSEYKRVFDRIEIRFKLAEKDTSIYVGKPFSDFVKHLKKCNLKITELSFWNYDSHKVYPQHLYAIRLKFLTDEEDDFAFFNKLSQPYIIITFEESKPYEKAMSLFREFKGNFTKEVEEFYSDALIKSIYFHYPDSIRKDF